MLPHHPCAPQAFAHLEMPAHLAVLRTNAGPAPRLCPAQLAAAREAALASAGAAQEQLRRIYNLPQLDLSNGDTVLQLLGALGALPWRAQGSSCNAGLRAVHLPACLARCASSTQRPEHLTVPCRLPAHACAGAGRAAPRAAHGATGPPAAGKALLHRVVCGGSRGMQPAADNCAWWFNQCRFPSPMCAAPGELPAAPAARAGGVGVDGAGVEC